MKNKNNLILLLVSMNVLSHRVWGMESNNTLAAAKPILKIYALPGLNNGGSKESYLQCLFPNYQLDITRIETPKEHSDLGQSQCINFMREKLNTALEKDNPEKAILHATSQGAATILNLIAESGLDKRITCLILEGTFTSGNRGITHTLKGRKAGAFGPLIHLPQSETWTPYVARLVRFWNYCPSGPQVIKSMPEIAKKIGHTPVIIVHGEKDVRVPLEDSSALYHGLKAQGLEDVYLIQENGAPHTHVLKYSTHARPVMQALLQKYKIVPPSDAVSDIDLKPYQPDHLKFQPIYDAILDEARMHERIAIPIYAAATVAAVYAGYKATSYVVKKVAGK